MRIDNHLLKAFATGDGSLTIEAQSLDDTGMVEWSELSKLATKYIKARWPHEKDWFLVDSHNNSVRFAMMVHPLGDGSVNIKDKNYEVYVKHERSEYICQDDIVVTHHGMTVKFAEVINPIVFYLNNKELFDVNQ